jgi:hypothetical protein
VNEVLRIFDCKRDEMAGYGTKALILGASFLCWSPNIIIFIKSIWHGWGMWYAWDRNERIENLNVSNQFLHTNVRTETEIVDKEI